MSEKIYTIEEIREMLNEILKEEQVSKVIFLVHMLKNKQIKKVTLI